MFNGVICNTLKNVFKPCFTAEMWFNSGVFFFKIAGLKFIWKAPYFVLQTKY